MSALLDSADQALPVTQFARQLKAYLDKISNQESDKYVVMRNNQPAAVLLSVERFESMVEELEELRVEALARERLSAFDADEAAETISHSDMLKRFED
ncbi:type II toxin-antitoxin system prevent-host-death family antitoxin [Endozoicomonas arenosclerae]|uniref:type II toxin-antitoxin system prevent-host-death family antitoxin n=1 Tax=Endozoicomonas arenosclerae TaxID=1633495 RepID=UPI000784EAF6|nr:type II toxin-antitoxin system prevent-host-death family antitoxin [Endozoicomonas arenosclerae]